MNPTQLDLPADHRPDETSLRPRSRRLLTDWTFSIGVLIVAVGWMFTLRPQSLGGPADYVMVRGISMVPTYHTGDLVIVRRQHGYSKGDIIAYHVPQGQVGAGIVVIHRIVGGGDAQGFVVKGDNNPSPDVWRPKDADIVGKAWILVPKAGGLLAFLHAPLALASLATGVAVAVLISDDGKRKRKRGQTSRAA